MASGLSQGGRSEVVSYLNRPAAQLAPLVDCRIEAGEMSFRNNMEPVLSCFYDTVIQEFGDGRHLQRRQFEGRPEDLSSISLEDRSQEAGYA